MNFAYFYIGDFMKEFALKLLYPHLAVIICLLPFSIALLVYSLIYFETTTIISIISYLFAFYMLVVVCFRLPQIINFFKSVKEQNKYVQKWFSDVHLRMNVSLYGSLIWNALFAIFQLGLGFHHNSLWFYSMAAYYIMLAIIRFFLVKHTRIYKANEAEQRELKKYLLCGWLLLLMNIALAIIVGFIVYWNKTFVHHEITAIAFAAYTFITLTYAIIGIIKYKKYNSPVYTAAKNISLIAACVSMLTLEATLLGTFGSAENPLFTQIILFATGAMVLGFAITMAIIMIVKGINELKNINKQ